MFRATMCPSSGGLTVSMRDWYVWVAVWSAGWDESHSSQSHCCPKHVEKLK